MGNTASHHLPPTGTDPNTKQAIGNAVTAPNIPNTAGRTLPLIITPNDDDTVVNLLAWIKTNTATVHALMQEHGAVLFRGFAVNDEASVEAIAKAIDPELKNDYMGTSPRDIQDGTDYVFSASELPPYYPIPQHCEMTFIKEPPRRIFFSCMVQPLPGGGETPLVDFRKVYQLLDSDVRERFMQRGIKIIRNYAGPKQNNRFNLFELKPWTSMFGFDKQRAQARAEQEGFEVHWTKNDGMRLTSYQPAATQHPETGETVWYSHLQVFHISTASGEFKRIYRKRPTLKNWGLWRASQALVATQQLIKKDDEHAMHCTYADGGKIPQADIDHLRDVIWDNMEITPWLKGDVVAVDNYSIAHGRLPYTGARKVVVAWA